MENYEDIIQMYGKAAGQDGISEAEEEERKAWHNAFYGFMELDLGHELYDYASELDLGKLPPRLDLIVITKKDGHPLPNGDRNDLAAIFRKYNIWEYKRPKAPLTIDDLAKTVGYAYLFKSQGRGKDVRPMDEFTVSVYRHAYPRGLVADLESYGYKVGEQAPGIYWVEGFGGLPVQIVVGKLLGKGQHAILRTLVEGAEEEDVRSAIDIYRTLHEKSDVDNAHAGLVVSSAVNAELYRKVWGEDDMYDMRDTVLWEFLKEDIDRLVVEREANAKKQGKMEGMKEGMKEGEKAGAFTAFLTALRNTMEHSGISAEAAMDLVGIAPGERPMYMAELMQ